MIGFFLGPLFDHLFAEQRAAEALSEAIGNARESMQLTLCEAQAAHERASEVLLADLKRATQEPSEKRN